MLEVTTTRARDVLTRTLFLFCVVPCATLSFACSDDSEDDEAGDGSSSGTLGSGTFGSGTLGSGTTGTDPYPTSGTAGPGPMGECALPSRVDMDLVIPTGCDVAVETDVTVSALLILEPGVTLRFAQNTGLDVTDLGALSAIGTAEAPISFTGRNETPGSWRGVIVRSNRAENVLEHVTLGFGGGTRFTGTDDEANLYLDGGARLSISDSMSTMSLRHGIWIEEGTTLSFSSNALSGNAGHPVVISQGGLGALDSASMYGLENGDDRVWAYATSIERAQTWSRLDVPVLLSGVATVTDALAIAAGARFEAEVDAGLDVDGGSLSVEGTEDAPVTMVGENTVPGQWRGIVIRSRDPINRLAFLEIRDAGGERFVGTDDEANLYVHEGGQVAIDHSTIANAESYGLYVEDGAVLTGYEANVFEDNASASARISAGILGFLDEGSRYDDHVEVFGVSVDDDATWPAIEVPYVVDGVINVDADIEVSSGATFTFAADAGIDVAGGSLSAVAEEGESIRFDGEHEGEGTWRGIIVRTNVASNVFERVVIRGGGGERFGGTDDEANLYFEDGARGSVRESTFEASQDYGVYFESGVRLDGWAGNTFSGNLQASVGVGAQTLGALDDATDYDTSADRGLEIRGETVTSDAAWAAFGGRAIFMGVTVVDAAVTVATGAHYFFDDDAGIDVNAGSLAATDASFTGLVETAGSWRGLVFRSGLDNVLVDSAIRYGGGERFGGTDEEANVYVVDGGRLTLTSCEISDSLSFGVYGEDDATLTTDALTFADNALGDLRLPGDL